MVTNAWLRMVFFFNKVTILVRDSLRDGLTRGMVGLVRKVLRDGAGLAPASQLHALMSVQVVSHNPVELAGPAKYAPSPHYAPLPTW